jgi:hypothetical protein
MPENVLKAVIVLTWLLSGVIIFGWLLMSYQTIFSFLFAALFFGIPVLAVKILKKEKI